MNLLDYQAQWSAYLLQGSSAKLDSRFSTWLSSQPDARSHFYQHSVFSTLNDLFLALMPVTASYIKELPLFLETYQKTYPPRDAHLYNTLAGVVIFLEEHSIGESLPPWLVDIAKIEWSERLSYNAVGSQQSLLHPSVILCKTAYPVLEVWEDLKQAGWNNPPDIEPQAALVLLYARAEKSEIQKMSIGPLVGLWVELLQQGVAEAEALKVIQDLFLEQNLPVLTVEAQSSAILLKLRELGILS
jgi:hypothetical protein